MPIIGVSITKSTSYRNATQEFSNVYHYEVAGTPTVAQADAFIDNLTALEKTFHGTNVTFVRGRCWTAGGTQAQNQMISQKNLSGTGARTAVAGLDKERAFLFKIRAGSDSRGNPVFLRKWFHASAQFVSGQSIPLGVMEQTSSWTSTERGQQVTAMQAIGDANGSPLQPALCARSGRGITGGSTWSAHPYLEHRQLGDMWRAS